MATCRQIPKTTACQVTAVRYKAEVGPGRLHNRESCLHLSQFASISAQSSGLYQSVLITSKCGITGDGGDDGGGVDVPDAIIGGPENTAFIEEHVITKSPCPQLIGVLDITNDGAAPMRWKIDWPKGLEVWLDVLPASGNNAPAKAQLQFNCNVPGPGLYKTTIELSSPDTGNSPRKIPVSVNVVDP